MPNYNDIQAKVEDALASVVTGLAIANLAVRKGLDVSELTLPCCVCSCDSIGAEIVRGVGAFPAECSVEIASSADPQSGEPGPDNAALTAHRALVATVNDAFRDDGIAATLSGAVSEFSVAHIDWDGFSTALVDRKFVSALRMTITCGASDVY